MEEAALEGEVVAAFTVEDLAAVATTMVATAVAAEGETLSRL